MTTATPATTFYLQAKPASLHTDSRTNSSLRSTRRLELLFAYLSFDIRYHHAADDHHWSNTSGNLGRS